MSARSRRPLLASVRIESPCQNGEPRQLGNSATRQLGDTAVLMVEPVYTMLERHGIYVRAN